MVVNAAASSVTERTRVVIAKALSADHDLTVADTFQRGHATRLAHEAATEGVDVVAVLGGDGTLNEAANGLVGSSTALAAIPGGSTNVFARATGFPNDAVEATGMLMDSLQRGSVRRVGIGCANGRYFLFNLGVGFDAAVVAQVEQRSGLKRVAGHPLFVYSAFATWFRHIDRKRPHFAVRLNDGTVVDDGSLAIVLNTNPYTYLGPRPLEVSPDVDLDEPLAVLTLRTLRLDAVAGLAARALVGGTAATRSNWVHFASHQHEVTISGYGPFHHQMDGEYLGMVSELSISHHPAMLDIVVP